MAPSVKNFQDAAITEETTANRPVRWNTEYLLKRVATDFASAGTAATAISPIITMIDKAIIEKAAKGLAIRGSIYGSVRQMFTCPVTFFSSTPFVLIYLLYFTTYVTANLIDTGSRTLSSTYGSGGFGTVTAGPVKFIATTAVNMSMCVYKDSRFAKFFGNRMIANSSATPRGGKGLASITFKPPPMPKASLGLFCARDSLTIFASFNLPPLLAPSIPDFIAPSAVAKANVAQFAIPSAIQVISTPIHLLGLDLYNRPHLPAASGTSGETQSVSASNRWKRVKRDWMPSFGARIARVAPAFGVGGVLNGRMRATLMGMIEQGQ
ncbi:hypothetical protein KEM54_005459 [Ascosphaera aggregata]|nr:hypothetical protein KEM54_005459 [Ascosphaera aggregata]